MNDVDIPTDPHVRREWIKYQLRTRGTNFKRMAEELGLKRCTTRSVLDKPYPRIEAEVARRLGLKPEQIWPERYDEQGSPIRPAWRVSSHGSQKATTTRKPRNGKSATSDEQGAAA